MDLAISKRSKHLVVVTILVILGWAAAAHAEDLPRAPAGTRDPADIPFDPGGGEDAGRNGRGNGRLAPGLAHEQPHEGLEQM